MGRKSSSRDETRFRISLPHFFDESYRGMSWEDEAKLLRNSMLSLERLSKSTNLLFSPKSIAEALPHISQDADCIALGELFARHGSDKSTVSDYHLIYAALLSGKRWKPREIGLGTYHLDTPSNMGRKGVPGASLRGFRDWAPQAIVRGADVDRRILFSEERITTHFVDQNDPESLPILRPCLARIRSTCSSTTDCTQLGQPKFALLCPPAA